MLFEMPGEFQNDKRTYLAYLYVELVNGLCHAGSTVPPNGGNLAGSGVRSGGIGESSIRRGDSVVAGFFEILCGRFDEEGRLVSCGVERSCFDRSSGDANEWLHRLDNGRGRFANGVVATEDGVSSATGDGAVDSGVGRAEVCDGLGGRLGRVDVEPAARKSSVNVGTVSFGQATPVRGPNYERNKISRDKRKSRLQALNKSLQQSWDERRVAENQLAAAKAKKSLESLSSDKSDVVRQLKTSIAVAKCEQEYQLVTSKDVEVLADAQRVKAKALLSKAQKEFDEVPKNAVSKLQKAMLELETENIDLKTRIVELEDSTSKVDRDTSIAQKRYRDLDYKYKGVVHRYDRATERIRYLESVLKQARSVPDQSAEKALLPSSESLW